ncbi:MAG TPA: ribosome maturation factor RimP [Pyrinomonadaceae bacterium]|nr:ribosome maturation factor RimP [Pyrinomonadaceae bacterium]
MEQGSILERVEKIAGAAAVNAGVELVHVELAGIKRDQVLRVYIDKEGGVTIEDCTNVSHGMEDVLDEDDFIPGKYVLEVSSPGIERALYSLADFVKFAGQLAKVKTKAAIDGQKTFIGVITQVDGQDITIDDRTKGIVTFPYESVDKANLKIDLAKEFGSKG